MAAALGYAIPELERMSPPSDIADEHERLVNAYRDARPTLEGLNPADPGNATLAELEAARAAEKQIKDKGYNIGEPFFGYGLSPLVPF